MLRQRLRRSGQVFIQMPDQPMDVPVLRLDNTSRPVMVIARRTNSFYHWVNNSVKYIPTIVLLGLHSTGNLTANWDVDPVVLAILKGDVKAVSDLATSDAHCLLKGGEDGWLPLHDAAYCGQTECLKVLLTAHPGTINMRTLEEQTALLIAVWFEHTSCVRYLLEAGADPNICSKSKETPLYKACKLEDVDMVSLLLSYGADVNQRCVQGSTALHEAVSRNNTEICELLIQAGASINAPNNSSITPLIVAAQQGQTAALHYLIGKGANVNMQTCDGFTALYEASRNGHEESVAELLTNHADANIPGNSGLLPLHMAAQYGHHKIVSLLIPVTSRARLRHSCISPLHLAAKLNRRTVAAVLLRTGADVNATLGHSESLRYADRRTTALYFALAHGSLEIAELLLREGASVSLDPVSPLFLALQHGYVHLVSLLLERGADPNTRIPSYLATFPTAVALCMNNLHMLKCLLDNGCDALSCFACTHGSGPHPAAAGSLTSNHSNGFVRQNGSTIPLTCSEATNRPIQFCEWISTPAMVTWAGPVIDLLLEYVGPVQLCSRLVELLDSRDEWLAIKRKSLSPPSLLHLCRLQIRTQMGRHRLKSLTHLPLPDQLIRYLSLAD